MGGRPGAGKTTLLLQACAAAPHYRAVFFGTDMHGTDLQAFAARVGAPTNMTIYGGGTLRWGEWMAKSMIKLEGARLLIIDPLPTVGQSEEEIVAAVREIDDWARCKNACAVLTTSLDREGNLKVPVEVEHMVDVVAVLGWPPDGPDDEIREPGGRVFDVQKNRRGPECDSVWLTMTSSGLAERPV